MAHHHEEIPGKEHERKLRKRERRLNERLQEALEAREKALERLQRAEERVQKRTARIQRIEARLALIRQQRRAPAPPSVNDTANRFVESTPTVEEEQHQQEQEREYSEESIPPITTPEEPLPASPTLSTIEEAVSEPDKATPEETLQQAQQARAVAEAAEQAARLAAQRAQQAEERLEQFGSGRHLSQELAQLQMEAERANAVAQEAEDKAQEAERFVMETEQPRARLVADEMNEEPAQTIDAPQQETEPPRAIEQIASDYESNETVHETIQAQSQDEASNRHPIEQLLANEPANIVTLDQEEETMAMIASMRTADVAAVAAAEAEAAAEASSVRTREARQAAEEADSFLQQIRAAIATGVLTDSDAASALRYAEREATYAHAALADAEAAEEQARRAAMNAEAEAEVAEGMSFAVERRSSYEEHIREVEHEKSSDNISDNGKHQSVPLDEEETLELPIIRPKESL